jgi:type IV secretory pathway VirB3-like protein
LAEQVQMHPVYRAINKPLTIWGVERRLFFLALVIGGATFNYFGSLLSGMAMFIGLYTTARWVTARDAQMIRILLNAGRSRIEYDPGKRDPFEVEVLPK